MVIKYTDKVIEHFTSPLNVGEIKNPSGKAIEGSPACGDMVSVTLKVNDKTRIIEDIKFKSYGCASNIATSSIMTTVAIGKTIDEAKNITHKEITDELGGLPNVKIHCSVLAVDTLKSAVRNYEKNAGILKDDLDVLNVSNLRLRLKSVINPATGVDVISSNLVKSSRIVDGEVSVMLNICKEYEYANNINEEILEHVETLKGFKGLDIKYTCSRC